MIAGLDSSFSRPTPAQVSQAWQGGIRIWGGYLATKPGVNLASPWDKASFDVVRTLGSKPIAYCSGLDDPAACRSLAEQWDVRLCLDVEAGIRDDGPWVQPWLDTSGAGLYGNCAVHQGRQAAFHVLSFYPGHDPLAVWFVGCVPPSGPLGWQWQGGHTEFGLDVDRNWFDDWFTGGLQDMTDEQWQFIQGMNSKLDQMWSAVGGDVQHIKAQVDKIAAATGVDPAVLAAAVAKVLGTKLSA